MVFLKCFSIFSSPVPKDGQHNKHTLKTGACDEDFGPYQAAERTLDKYGIESDSLPRRGCHPTKLELASKLEGASLDNPADINAVMLWSYRPSHATDIAVSKGERVNVFYRNGDWAFIRNSKDEQGFVPLNYITLRRRNSLTESPMVLMRTLGKASVKNSSGKATVTSSAEIELFENSTEGTTVSNSSGNSTVTNSLDQTIVPKRVTATDSNMNNTVNKVEHNGYANKSMPPKHDKKLPILVNETSEWFKLFQYYGSDTDSTESSDEDMLFPSDIFGRISVNFQLHGTALSSNHSKKPCKTKDLVHPHRICTDKVSSTLQRDRPGNHIFTGMGQHDRKYLTLQNGRNYLPTYFTRDTGYTLDFRPTINMPENSSMQFAETRRLKTDGHTGPAIKLLPTDLKGLYMTSQTGSQINGTPEDSKPARYLGSKFKAVSSGDEMVAAYDFSATASHDLSITAGQRVRLINITDENWWWVRAHDGREGFVPKTFLMTERPVEYLADIKIPSPSNSHNKTDKPYETSIEKQSFPSNIYSNHVRVEHPLSGAFSLKQDNPSRYVHSENDMDKKFSHADYSQTTTSGTHTSKMHNIQSGTNNKSQTSPESASQNMQLAQRIETDSRLYIENPDAKDISAVKSHLQQEVVFQEEDKCFPKVKYSTKDHPEAGTEVGHPVVTEPRSYISDTRISNNTRDELYDEPAVHDSNHNSVHRNKDKNEPVRTHNKPALPTYDELMSKRTDSKGPYSQDQNEDSHSTRVWLTDSQYDNKPRILRRRQTISGSTNKRVRFQEDPSDSDGTQDPVVTVHRYDNESTTEISQVDRDVTLSVPSDTKSATVNDNAQTESSTWC